MFYEPVKPEDTHSSESEEPDTLGLRFPLMGPIDLDDEGERGCKLCLIPFRKIDWLRAIFWVICLFACVGAGFFQVLTGPTYPLRGSCTIGVTSFDYRLPRHHVGNTPVDVKLHTGDPELSGILEWKRLDVLNWTTISMDQKNNGTLEALLPGQKENTKVHYIIILSRFNSTETAKIPLHGETLIRFEAYIPLYIFIPHITLFILTLIFGVRTGLECLLPSSQTPIIMIFLLWTLLWLIPGGFIFGPLLSYYAFGEAWTGIPNGYDWTDNKTLIALICLLISLSFLYWGRKLKIGTCSVAKIITFTAILIMVVTYFIPHSI